MTIDQFATHPSFQDVQIHPEQLACCRYLEKQGQRFLIDFGYENAQAKVWDFLSHGHEFLDFEYDQKIMDEYRRVVFDRKCMCF